jgi:mRNA interferase MazF
VKAPGKLALTPFPHTDLSGSKLRPVLLIRPASSRFDDWLVCMVSSQIHQVEAGLDEILMPDDPAFPMTGLKSASAIRLSMLAVLEGRLLLGAIGELPDDRFRSIRQRLGDWISQEF